VARRAAEQRDELTALSILPRMAGASAQEEIDETISKGLRPRDDIANLELLVQCSWTG
jgi:hypothetical protein